MLPVVAHVSRWVSWSLLLQLGQGVLVQVSPSLVKRQKTHFHDLPCGASVILGNNGFIWIYPTTEQKDEEAGGFTTNLEVRGHGVWRTLFYQWCFASLTWSKRHINLRLSRNGFEICGKTFYTVGLHYFPVYSSLFLSVLPQPVPLSDREVISRLRNCIVALATQKLMLFDTSILYCYEASLSHQVQKPVSYTLFHMLGRDWEGCVSCCWS